MAVDQQKLSDCPARRINALPKRLAAPVKQCRMGRAAPARANRRLGAYHSQREDAAQRSEGPQLFARAHRHRVAAGDHLIENDPKLVDDNRVTDGKHPVRQD
ncbi:MAG: hypothetical protein ABI810_14200 [Sphingomonas bacterium]